MRGLVGTVQAVSDTISVLFADSRSYRYLAENLEHVNGPPEIMTEGFERDRNTGPVVMYRNAFADGRRGGWYFSREEARQAAPRCRQMERGVFYADGPVITQEEIA